MGRNHRNTRKRHEDTRLSLNEMARIMGLNWKQKIIMRRYLLKRLKGGEL